MDAWGTVEQEAMTALRMLVAAGFRTFTLGDPAYPESLVYVSARLDVRDLVRVYGPDECEAIRMIHKRSVKQVDGTTPEVVATVLGWPSIFTASGLDL